MGKGRHNTNSLNLIMCQTSLAGHTLHLRRKGLVSCLYATCASCYITVGNAYVMDNEYD